MDWITLTGCCEDGNEHSGWIKRKGFFDYWLAQGQSASQEEHWSANGCVVCVSDEFCAPILSVEEGRKLFAKAGNIAHCHIKNEFQWKPKNFYFSLMRARCPIRFIFPDSIAVKVPDQ